MGFGAHRGDVVNSPVQLIKQRVFNLKSLTVSLITLTLVLYTIWISYLVIYDKPADFYAYYLAANGFAHSKDIYGAYGTDIWIQLAQESGISNYAPPYRYPPLTAMIVFPLTFLTPKSAASIWLVASALAFMASAYLLGATSQSVWGMPVAWGLFLFFTPVLTTLNAGQVNGFVLLALSGSIYAFSRNKPVFVGIGVAIGAMLKLVPIAHLGYLGWRHQWRALTSGIITLLLLFTLSLPLIRVSGLVSYIKNFFVLGEAGNLIRAGINQSVNGFFARVLTAGNGEWFLLDDPNLAQRLTLVSSLVLVLFTIGVCFPSKNASELYAWEFALVTVAINLITPYAWYHQFVLLLIPFFVIIDHIVSNSTHRWMLVPLGIGYLLTSIHGLVWHYIEPLPWVTSTPFYTAIMLWGILAYWIVRNKAMGLQLKYSKKNQ